MSACIHSYSYTNLVYISQAHNTSYIAQANKSNINNGKSYSKTTVAKAYVDYMVSNVINDIKL